MTMCRVKGVSVLALVVALALGVSSAWAQEPPKTSEEKPAKVEGDKPDSPAPKAEEAVTEGWGPSRILKETEKLAEELGMPWEKQADLLTQVRTAVEDPWFAGIRKESPIYGLFVFSAGEGGLLVKFMKGEGKIVALGGRRGKIKFKSWSVGALAGGASQWGVGLVLGLVDFEIFGGKYKGGVKYATAGNNETKARNVLSFDTAKPAEEHEVYLISAASGLSAGAGKAKMEIAVKWEER
jgi:hypothetical protein